MLQSTIPFPFKEYSVTDEYSWLNNYAVLYQNTQADNEYFLNANNLRCALTILPTIPADIDKSPHILYINEIFSRYAETFCRLKFDCEAAVQHSPGISKIIYHVRSNPANKGIAGIIDTKKHEVILEYKEAEKSHRDFVIEGERLVKRAVDNGLTLKNIIFSSKSSTLEKEGYIPKAHCPCYSSNEGIMAAITSSRPVPAELALCAMPYYSLDSILYGEHTSLLITDEIQNPDNLGLVIRTADACGVDAVIVTGNGAAPYHKNCVRASRGAMGRLPILKFDDGKSLLARLKFARTTVIGTSAHAESISRDMNIPKKFAVIIGSESFGMSPEMSELCDTMVKIDMAHGQSSFNVAVAAGIILNRLMQ